MSRAGEFLDRIEQVALRVCLWVSIACAVLAIAAALL